MSLCLSSHTHPPSFCLSIITVCVAGCHARISRLPGVTACCIRKGRRRLPAKVNWHIINIIQELQYTLLLQHVNKSWQRPVGLRDRHVTILFCPIHWARPFGVLQDNNIAACVDKLRNYSHDSYQREYVFTFKYFFHPFYSVTWWLFKTIMNIFRFWLPPYGKRDRRQVWLKFICSGIRFLTVANI